VRAFSSKRRTSGTHASREVAEPRSGERGVQPQAAGEAVAEASEYEKEIHSYGKTNDAVVRIAVRRTRLSRVRRRRSLVLRFCPALPCPALPCLVLPWT